MAGGGRKRRGGKRSAPPKAISFIYSSRNFDSPLPTSRSGGRISGGSASRSGNSGRPTGSSYSSRGGSRNPTVNAYRYDYPAADPQGGLCLDCCDENSNRPTELDESRPSVLVNSTETPVVAFVDQKASKEPINVEFTYDYDSDLVLGDSAHNGLGFCDDDDSSHKGLGFCAELEGAPSELGSSLKNIDEHQLEKEMDVDTEDVLGNSPSPERNSGFLSIGGMRLYTQDISDKGSDKSDDGGSPDDELSGSDWSEEASDSNSDIDEELAEDYLEGVGGSDEILDGKWLLGTTLDVGEEEDDDSSSCSSFDEARVKLGGMALEEASSQYGMKKPQSSKKLPVKSCELRASGDVWTPALDDLMLVKDPRRLSAKKKHAHQFPQSWPAQKGISCGNFPGAKKKHHKELIALKRRERMKHRGVDLEQINTKLKKMVLNEVDALSFQPMHSRDCSQVQRLAAIYRLRSGCQGSGKKRFVTVTRTMHTCMPSSSDKLRLDKLLGSDNKDDDFTLYDDPKMKSTSRGKNWVKKISSKGALSPVECQLSSQSRSSKKSSNRYGSRDGSGSKQKGISFANQPVSFVSSGHMLPGTVEDKIVNSGEKNDTNGKNEGGDSTSKVGTFELHTKGFGSKMMAKMGFVVGEGLGKDGQGMVEPIEAIQRPKLLGLGVQYSEDGGIPARNDGGSSARNDGGSSARNYSGKSARNRSSNSAGNELQKIGGFERHTKGFGSKMMAKMGFVEGAGLGRDSQGIVNPLVAVRRPKLQGLGARG